MAIPEGTKLSSGSVADTCEGAGMHAVCAGGSKCGYNPKPSQMITPRCIVSPILTSDGCDYLNTLSKRMCGTGISGCPVTDNLFVHMDNYGSGEHGVVGRKYVGGNTYISGQNGQVYYAYCALCEGCSGNFKILLDLK